MAKEYTNEIGQKALIELVSNRITVRWESGTVEQYFEDAGRYYSQTSRISLKTGVRITSGKHRISKSAFDRMMKIYEEAPEAGERGTK